MSGHALERIRFSPNVASEVRAAIEPHLVKWAFLIPAWCHELTVKWDDDDTSSALCVKVFYEYRSADLIVLPNFLTSPAARERDVVHELLHLSLAPLTIVCEAMRDALVKQAPDVEEWANEMLRHGEEATTCDLTELAVRRFA
jgi:hypothetical protein